MVLDDAFADARRAGLMVSAYVLDDGRVRVSIPGYRCAMFNGRDYDDFASVETAGRMLGAAVREASEAKRRSQFVQTVTREACPGGHESGIFGV